MSFYLRAFTMFLTIVVLLGALIWQRYQNLYTSQMALREATFHGAYEGIVNTFRLVSKSLAEEVLQQEEVTELVHAIVTAQGEERNRLRGLLYRQLSPMYDRVSQHSIRQFHFHFADGRSMLRLHAPHLADDDLTPFRPSVLIANTQHREVHGYESGRIVHGFRHVYPLTYRDTAIGSVELSNSFQQIYSELIKHVASEDSQYMFIMLKSDLWDKLSSGHRELYHASVLHDDYLCENSMANSYNQLGGTARVTEHTRDLLKHLRTHSQLSPGLESGEDFTLTTDWHDKVYAVLFHSIKNVSGQHAAYILSIHPEPYVQALKTSMIVQFVIAVLFASALTVFQMKLTRAREEQQKTTDFLLTLTEYMGEGLYATDKKGDITFMNQEASRLLGYKADDSLHKNAHDLFHVNDPRHQEHGCPILDSILNKKTYAHEQNVFQPLTGEPIPVELTCTPFVEKGEIAGTITLFHDITLRRQQELELEKAQQRLKKANRTLAKQAHIDGLTGIANRRLFDKAMGNLWKAACRNQKPLSLLMIDLDHFKLYNDTYGHLQGDECLRVVADVIQSSCLRPEDFVARYGGEEFVALLPDTNLDDACFIAERIQHNLQEQKIAHIGSPLAKIVTFSIGICSLQPDVTIDPQVLIDCADSRLYRAKRLGRNRICSQASEKPGLVPSK